MPAKLDRTLIVIRILYFVVAISHAATYQWSVIYFADYFTLAQFGVIHGIKFLIRFVGSIIWGYFGDYWPNKKFLLFIIGQLFCVICMSQLYLIPSLSTKPIFRLFSLDFSFQFIFTIGISMCEQYGSSSFTLLEAVALILSGNTYGTHRFYVAFGHGFGSLLCAVISQLLGSHSVFIIIYDISIMIAIILLIFELAVNKKISSNLSDTRLFLTEGVRADIEGLENENDDQMDEEMTIWRVLFNPGWILVIFNVFLFGIGH
eukprot:188496_1